jgi:hypothetical protein
MKKRVMRTSTLSALALLLALLGCALADTQVTKPASPPTATLAKAPSLPSVHQVAQTTTLNGGSTGPVTATCPQGEFALGGGWSVPTQGAEVFAAVVNGNTWAVSAQPLGHRATTEVTAYVECLSGAAGAVVTRREIQYSIDPNPINDYYGHVHLIGCLGADEIPVGIGFDFGAVSRYLKLRGISVQELDSPAGLDWYLAVLNHDTAPHTVPYYVQCLSNVTQAFPLPQHPGNVRPVVVEATYFPPDHAVNFKAVAAGTSGFIQQDCPSGTVVAGGGVTNYGDALGSLTFLRATSTGWQGEMFATETGKEVSLSVVAECLRFS